MVSQFTVIEYHHHKGPELLLFVNGIPLVVVELKNAASEKSTLRAAFQQLETYKQTIPSLFNSNVLLVISDGLEARAGSLSAGFSRFMSWKGADGKREASRQVNQLEILIHGMLNKQTLLDLFRHFIVFETYKREDPQSKVVQLQTVKKLAAYHQYYAVNAAVASTLRAADCQGARLAKFVSGEGGPSDEALETTIRQVIDKALVSEQVIDVFEAAGIKKPDISVLLEEFLAELRGMPHKNVVLEVLKKLLNDELKQRAKKNLVQSKSRLELLEQARGIKTRSSRRQR